MSLGNNVYALLKERGIASSFVFADIQELKGAADARALRAFLAKKGCPCEPERESALHFADLIELWISRRTLRQAEMALLLWS